MLSHDGIIRNSDMILYRDSPSCTIALYFIFSAFFENDFFWKISALAFLLTEGAFDKAEEWTQLTAAQRSSVKSQYAAAGIKIIVSVFGSTDAPTSSGADPIATANTMAAWVTEFDLDGIDVDYEVGLGSSIVFHF